YRLKEMIFDHLHARDFQYTPLGRTIVGPLENVKTVTKTHLYNGHSRLWN
ncbi:hypothetical protein SOVF_192490, partial [Spinacia oleracea]